MSAVPVRIVSKGPKNKGKKREKKKTVPKAQAARMMLSGNAYGKVSGLGEAGLGFQYSDAPVAKGFKSRTLGANMSASPSADAKLKVRHREFISDVTASNDFQIYPIAINPGLASTFPWLSKMAVIYECYRIRNLVFSFESTVPSTTVGSVYLGIDYDSYDTPPLDKATLLSYQGTTRSQVWQRTSLVVPPASMNKAYSQRFVRSGPIDQASDLKTYDVGTFYVAVSGCSESLANTQIGELYVSYDIELITPTGEGTDAQVSSCYYYNSGEMNVALNPIDITCFPESNEQYRYGNLDASATVSTIFINTPGTYRLTLAFTSSGFITIPDNDISPVVESNQDIPATLATNDYMYVLSYRIRVTDTFAMSFNFPGNAYVYLYNTEVWIESIPPNPLQPPIPKAPLKAYDPSKSKKSNPFFSNQRDKSLKHIHRPDIKPKLINIQEDTLPPIPPAIANCHCAVCKGLKQHTP